uniref:DUF7583 domain-containing protein n=1 Tax=Strongyloides papillosus TaxID=174720 RepID=A0A0N5C7V9_STREA
MFKKSPALRASSDERSEVAACDKTKVENIKHVIVQERKIFKLKEKFVVVKDRNPNGTLVCLYNVSSGEVSVSQKFETFEIKSKQKKGKKRANYDENSAKFSK